MPKISIYLISSRLASGCILIEDDTGDCIWGPWSVLGRAGIKVSANPQKYNIDAEPNPESNPKLKAGHTPSGNYRVIAAIQTGHNATVEAFKSAASYGNNGGILLYPVSGEALTARTKGRTAFLIHGGSLHNGKLRPAAGNLRMSDENMAQLLTALNDLTIEKKEVNICTIHITAEQDLPTALHPIEATTISDEGIDNEKLHDPPLHLTNNNWILLPIYDIMPNLPDPNVVQGNIPLGTIIAFAGDKNRIHTYQGKTWLICDGRPLNKVDFPLLFNAIGEAWGATETQFWLPDLRGMFMRGVADDSKADPDADSRKGQLENTPYGINKGNKGNKVGSVQSDAYFSHSHNTPTKKGHYLFDGASGLPTANTFVPGGGGGLSFSAVTGDAGGKETRPKNVYVYYIIKADD